MYLKKYLTEGLIQVAILLSLSGMRVDVGLEPGRLSPLREMVLGPSAGITQTQFHNLWNRLEDGQPNHPKNVDLDRFTSRRLLSLVRSLDRLQVGTEIGFRTCFKSDWHASSNLGVPFKLWKKASVKVPNQCCESHCRNRPINKPL